jgi:hypothetical protein
MPRIRLVPLIVTAIVTLAVLFGGYQAYQRFNMIDPLEAQLKTVDGVENVQVQAGNPIVVRIELGPVKDLQTTYHEVSHTVTQVVGSEGDVVLVDHANATLNEAYETLQPYLLEGVAKGNYTEMMSAVQGKAQKMGINARITMDEHNIYVQLSQGDHYLYHVLPYALHQGGSAS